MELMTEFKEMEVTLKHAEEKNGKSEKVLN